MKYDQIKNLSEEQFRRLTGVKRKTFEKMTEILQEVDQRKKAHSGRRTNYRLKISF